MWRTLARVAKGPRWLIESVREWRWVSSEMPRSQMAGKSRSMTTYLATSLIFVGQSISFMFSWICWLDSSMCAQFVNSSLGAAATYAACMKLTLNKTTLDISYLILLLYRPPSFQKTWYSVVFNSSNQLYSILLSHKSSYTHICDMYILINYIRSQSPFTL